MLNKLQLPDDLELANQLLEKTSFDENILEDADLAERYKGFGELGYSHFLKEQEEERLDTAY